MDFDLFWVTQVGSHFSFQIMGYLITLLVVILKGRPGVKQYKLPATAAEVIPPCEFDSRAKKSLSDARLEIM